MCFDSYVAIVVVHGASQLAFRLSHLRQKGTSLRQCLCRDDLFQASDYLCLGRSDQEPSRPAGRPHGSNGLFVSLTSTGFFFFDFSKDQSPRNCVFLGLRRSSRLSARCCLRASWPSTPRSAKDACKALALTVRAGCQWATQPPV